MAALDRIDDWPVDNVAAAVVGRNGVVSTRGDTGRPFPLASVTKPLVARAAQVAVEEGAFALDTEAGPPGSTVRHLLAHTSGFTMHSDQVLAEPGTRRIYSNYGFTVLGETLQQVTGIDFDSYVLEAVCRPLAMTATELGGGAEAAGYGATSTVADLAAFAGDLLAPTTVSAQLHDEATSVQFPGIDGVLPGFGVQRPNDWGLGFEIKGEKSPHWTGQTNSARTYGHFGQSGTFLWVEPDRGTALVVLTDRPFGEWAMPLWPALSDAVLAEGT